MKAAVLTKQKQLELVEVQKPIPEKDDVIVRIAYTGICGSDVHLFTWQHPLAKPGMILGHEFSGTVDQVGSECRSLKTGDKVCAHIIESCGHCDACKKGYFNLCKELKVLGTQADGTFAEYVRVKADKVLRLPDDADLRVFALAEPLAVGVYAVKRSGLEVSDTAIVIGAGPIGLSCAIAAQKAGASQVVLSEISPEKIAFAKARGFTVIDSKHQDLEREMDRITGGTGFDRIYETSGAPISTELVTKVGAVRASVILVAYSKEPRPIDTWNLMRKEIQISSLRVHTQPAYEAAVKMLQGDPELCENMQQMITGEFPFQEIQKAFELCSCGKGGCKTIIDLQDH